MQFINKSEKKLLPDFNCQKYICILKFLVNVKRLIFNYLYLLKNIKLENKSLRNS